MTKAKIKPDADNDLETPRSDAGVPATVAAASARPDTEAPLPPSATRIDGALLVPNIEQRSRAVGTSRQFRYWVGVSPGCPVEGIDMAGINFPKINQKLVDDPGRSGNKARVPVVGALVWLTEDKIRRLREQLPRTVIRFLQEQGEVEEAGTGENIGDNATRPRKGHIITIPSAATLTSRREKGKPTREYTPDVKRDVPAGRFMFAQLCANQTHGERGDFYPEPLEVSGLEWPDHLEAEVASLLK